MTATGGDQFRHRVSAANALRLVAAAGFTFICGFSVAEADEPIGGLMPSLTAPTALHFGATIGEASLTTGTKNPRSAHLVNAIPPAPPPRPFAPTALESLAAPTHAVHDLAVDLERGQAKIVTTGSASTPPYTEGLPNSVVLAVPPRPEPEQATTGRPAPSVVPPRKAVRVGFTPGAADLPKSAGPTIDEIATLMTEEPGLRLQLLAFATATTENASQSRRLSLHRALAVRGALIEAGVRSTRIDVRALGSQTDETPTDRVDILVVSHGGG